MVFIGPQDRGSNAGQPTKNQPVALGKITSSIRVLGETTTTAYTGYSVQAERHLL